MGSDNTLFIVGATASADFPVTPGALATGLRGERDASLMRLSPDGSALSYSTYLGGSEMDQARSIAMDSRGDIVMTGSTSSSDFPTTAGAYDPTYNGGGDIFVTRLRLGAVIPAPQPRMYLPRLSRR